MFQAEGSPWGEDVRVIACRIFGGMVSNGKVGERETQGGQGVPIRKELTTKESEFVLKPRTFLFRIISSLSCLDLILL